MPKKLQTDSTLISIWSSLRSGCDFLRKIRWDMEKCSEANGNSHVRIGITGTGQKPCYRIFYRSNSDEREVILGSYWHNHTPLENEKAVNINWSKNSSSFQEVHALFLENCYPQKA